METTQGDSEYILYTTNGYQCMDDETIKGNMTACSLRQLRQVGYSTTADNRREVI